MMTRKELDLWVGIFAVIGIGAMLFLSLKVANLASFSAADSYQITAKFDNIGGLKVRAPVKSAGVVVGRVGEIRFDNERSEERRVGKECRSRWSTNQLKKNRTPKRSEQHTHEQSSSTSHATAE